MAVPKGISTGEMPDALIHLGFDGSGLSPTSVTRMTGAGRANIASGASAISRRSTMFISGPTASTSPVD